jgi:hypothetical protein
MAFFDKLAKNASSIAKGVGDKAGEAVELSKLSAKAMSEKGAAAEAIKKIGEFYYKKFLEGGEVEAELAEIFAEAKSHFDLADELQVQIDELKGKIKAPIEMPEEAAEETVDAAEAAGVEVEEAAEEAVEGTEIPIE